MHPAPTSLPDSMTTVTNPTASGGTSGRRARSRNGLPQSGRPTEEKRAALVRAAVELFSSMPYEDVSVDALVDRAASAHGMVSYHFGSKRGLFAEAVAAVWSDFAQFTGRRADETTPSEIVRGYVRRHLGYAQKHPERFALMFLKHTDKEVDESLERARTEGIKQITAGLGCPTEQSSLLESAAAGWQGFLAGAITKALTNPPASTERFVEMCVAVLVAAVNAVNGVALTAETEDTVLAEVAGLPRAAEGLGAVV